MRLQGDDGFTLLHWSANEGLIPLLEWLVTKGDDVLQATDNWGAKAHELSSLKDEVVGILNAALNSNS